MGLLIYKDINKIANGIYVDYRDDRIVFTDTNEWSKDFCAFVSLSDSVITSTCSTIIPLYFSGCVV